MAHSPHRQWKGCPTCKMHKHKGNGDARRTPIRELRKLGVRRRWNRHAVSTDHFAGNTVGPNPEAYRVKL